MYAHQHLAVSLGTGVVVSLAATGGLDAGFLAGAALGSELIDVVDHPLYQALTWRRGSALRQALRTARSDGLRERVRTMKRLEDERTINGLLLHNAYGLGALVVAALGVGLLSNSPFWTALLTATVGHMLCDILWDFRFVGHARNWFARAGMPWLRPRWARPVAAHGLLWLTLASTSLWWLLERCWSALADPAPLAPSEVAYRTLSIGVAGYLTALGVATYLHARWVRRTTAVRCPVAKESLVPTAVGRLLDRFRPARGDALTAAAAVAGLIMATLLLLGWWAPSFLEVSGRPTMLALGVPLTICVIAMTMRHTTAAALGTLVGISAANVLNGLLSGTDHRLWSAATAMAILLSGLAGWLSGLVFSRLLGRIGGSAVVLWYESREQVQQVVRIVEAAYRDLLDEGSIVSLGPPATEVVRSPASVWAVGTGPDTGQVSMDGPLTVRVRAVYSPLKHESAALLGPTLDDRPVLPLLPRTQASARPCHVHAQAGRLRWPEHEEDDGRGTARAGIGLVKPLSEIVDNFVTRRADLQTDVVAVDDESGCLVVREVTSTKHYTTPEAEHLAVLLTERLTEAGVKVVDSVRVTGSASLHDLPPQAATVATGRPRPLPGASMDELRPATVTSVLAQTVVGVTTVAAAVQVVAWAVHRR